MSLYFLSQNNKDSCCIVIPKQQTVQTRPSWRPIWPRVLVKAPFVGWQTYCLWPCSLAVPGLAGWIYGFLVLCPGTPEGSTGSCSVFKASQKTGQQLKVSSDRLGEAGNRTCDHWFTRHRFIPYTTMVDLNALKNMVWIPSLTVHDIPPLDIICHGVCLWTE